MRVLIQRVCRCSVTIEGREHASIAAGMVLLVGVEDEDTSQDVEWLADKIVRMRIFDDATGVMNLSVGDVGGQIMVVSQFTLFASTRKGNRPSYIRAAKPDVSIPLYQLFCQKVEAALGRPVSTGVFGADMKVSLVNDGPVTIWMDSKQKE